MNKLILIIVFVVLGILGISFYASQQPKPQQETMVKDHTTMDKDEHDPSTSLRLRGSDSRSSGQSTMMDEKSDSRYVEYSKSAFDNVSDKRTVLYFYANWCPICRPADVNFKENANKIPEDVVVVRVNYNDSDTDQEEKDLAQKYGVTYQHTFVQIDKQGNKITAWNGGQIDELLSNIK